MNRSTSLLLLITLLCSSLGFTQDKMICLEGFSEMKISEKSYDDAVEIYEIIRDAPMAQSTHKHRANNCENRAGFSFRVLQAKGFNPINFFLFKEGLIEEAYDSRDKVKNSPGFTYYTGLRKKPAGWGYHVAAGIIIENAGTIDTLVYDPWTQDTLVSLRSWALDFYQARPVNDDPRAAYVFPVDDNYKFYGTTEIKQVARTEEEWKKQLDTTLFQTYCGLCGITPNSKCNKRRFFKKIKAKEAEINAYLLKFDIIIK